MRRRTFIAGLLTLPFAGSAVKAAETPRIPVRYIKPYYYDVSLIETPTDPACVIEKKIEEEL